MRNENSEQRAPSLATHIVIRTAPGMVDEAGQPIAPGTAVDAAMWRPRILASWVEQRYLEPIVMDTEAQGRQALARADQGIAAIEAREQALKAEGDQLEQQMAKLRKEANELERYRRRLGEVEREMVSAQEQLSRVGGNLEQLPAQRQAYEHERHRGRTLLAGMAAAAAGAK